MKKLYKMNLVGWLLVVACLMSMAHGYAKDIASDFPTTSIDYSQDTILRTIGSFTYTFNTNLDGWTLIDNDGDGHCWYHSSEGGNHGSGIDTITGHVRGESYCNNFGALTPDDYLVSPQRYGIVNNSTISFWARAQDANYAAEHFGVAISTSASGNANAASFTTIQEWTLTAKREGGFSIGREGRQINDVGTWHQYTCNLSSYTGQKVWIAIRHFNCTDQYIIGIDDIMINNVDTWSFEQGFVTDPDAMSNGADASWTKNNQTTLGINANHNGAYRLADEFTINAQTNINEITVYGYQTGSTTTSTFTGLYVQIFNGSPMNGGTAIWGNTTTNIMTAASFTNCYRGSNGETGGTTRPIMGITASGLNIQLAAGTYYLVYSLTGSGSSGPWGVPHAEPGVGNTGNGMQYTSDGWIAMTDDGSGTTMGIAMTLNGTQTGATYYTINVSANPNNGGSPYVGNTPGVTQGTYSSGQSCTVHANPANGYSFLKWTENGNQVSTSANYTFTVNSNRNLVAHYTQQNYNISVSASPTNGGTVTGGGAFHYGDNCTVNATAANGYTFTNWTENGNVVSTQANYQFVVTGNRTLVAHFTTQAPNTYTINVSASPTNGGTVSGGGTYQQGHSCTVHATANSGYSFTNWTENGNVVSTSANYTFTVNSNRNLVAHFMQLYTINVSASPTDGGTVTGGGTYQQGQQCTVIATAAQGFTFTDWTENGSVVSTDPNYSFPVISNRTLVANFTVQAPNTYSINVLPNPNNGGNVTGGGTYQHGQQCIVTATANDGYTFINWTEDGIVVSTQASYTFTVNSNRTLVANFQIQSFNVTVTIDPVEGGTVTGEGTYNYGVSCTLLALPNNGYTFVGWEENGILISTDPVMIFVVIEDVSYVAHFVQSINSYTITASADPAEGGSVSGGGNFSQGEECTLTATPNNGYTFANWTKNGSVVSEELSFSFTVTENATYVAHFTQNVSGFTISVSANLADGGSVTGAGTYAPGLTCILTATANEGYKFVNWTENGVIQWLTEQYSFVVDRDRTLIANFEALPTFTISAMSGPNGSITPQGDVVVVKGSDQTFTMTPNTGGCIVKVLVDGIDLGPIESYTFTNVNHDHTIYVSFSGMGVEETQALNVNVYPNPAKDKVYVECEGIEAVILYDMLGNCLRNMNYNTGKVLNVSGLPQGTYVLKLVSKDGRVGYQKLVLD